MTARVRRLPVLRQVAIRPRLFLALGAGLIVGMLLPPTVSPRLITRLIVAWNAGALFYLVMAAWVMAKATHEQIRVRADEQDEGAVAILTLVVAAALASLGAIVAELAVAKDLGGVDRIAHIGLATLTILSSWAFTQVMFALHYAHDFYLDQARGGTGGLVFPDTRTPDYVDFLYFAAVIGTSGQTADVAIASPGMRRIGLVHCVLAFLFNTSLVALMINVASSLI